jgi:CO/xanthine dehydrogenase FAD-binding subunit
VAAARVEIAPITDLRASAAYRRELVAVMLRRMLERAQRAREG